MKGFKRIASLFLVCCLCMALLPISALATETIDSGKKGATADVVYVNGVCMTDGDYWKNGDTYSASGNASDYNAYFSNGTLYLNNANITETYFVDGWKDDCIYAEGNLNIDLSGSNTISNGSADYGIDVRLSTLTITGNGSLSLNLKNGSAITDEGHMNIYNTTLYIQEGGMNCLGRINVDHSAVTINPRTSTDGNDGITCTILNVTNSKLVVYGGLIGNDEEGELYVSGDSLVSLIASDGAVFGFSTHTSGLSVAAGSNEDSAKRISNLDSVDASQYDYISIYSKKYSANRFVDVSAYDWFYDSVGYIYNNGLMVGTGHVRFSPYTTMDRAMAAKVLHNFSLKSNQYALPVGASESFSDVPANTWYTAAVNWARATGLVLGTGYNQYSPNTCVTREQFSVMLYHYAQKLGKAGAAPVSMDGFVDKDSVSSWATDGMVWAVSSGVMKGNDKNRLNPQGDLSRAEAVAMLERFVRVIA